MGKKHWKSQPIVRLSSHSGRMGRPWHTWGHAQNFRNLLVLSAGNTDSQSSKPAEASTGSNLLSVPISSDSEKQPFENESNIPTNNEEKDFDEISDSPLLDDESNENWENISDASLEEMNEDEEYGQSESYGFSHRSRTVEFCVGYRSCRPKYLSYKAKVFFKPKLNVLSENRYIISCLNIEEKSSPLINSAAEGGVASQQIYERVDNREASHISSWTSLNMKDDMSKTDEVIGTSGHEGHDDCSSVSSSSQVESRSIDKDCYQGAILIKDKIDKTRDPVVGLEYIVEVWEKIGSFLQHYFCVLCEEICEKNHIMDHILSDDHRIAYLVKHFPSRSSVFSQALPEALNEHTKIALGALCKEIDETCGRLLSFITTGDFISSSAIELKDVVNSSFHHGDECLPASSSVPADSGDFSVCANMTNPVTYVKSVEEKNSKGNKRVNQKYIAGSTHSCKKHKFSQRRIPISESEEHVRYCEPSKSKLLLHQSSKRGKCKLLSPPESLFCNEGRDETSVCQSTSESDKMSVADGKRIQNEEIVSLCTQKKSFSRKANAYVHSNEASYLKKKEVDGFGSQKIYVNKSQMNRYSKVKPCAASKHVIDSGRKKNDAQFHFKERDDQLERIFNKQLQEKLVGCV